MYRFLFAHLLLGAAVVGGAVIYTKMGPKRHRGTVGSATGLLVGQQVGALAGLVVAGPVGLLAGGMAGGVAGSVVGRQMATRETPPAAPIQQAA